MRVAAVDLGTNTALLLIAERRGTDGGFAVIANHAEIVRLGEGVDRTGRLDAAAMERSLAALSRYGAIVRGAGVDRAGAVGTQALREVENGAAFLARAQAALGFPVEVIDGEREARLSWRAVAASFPPSPAGLRTVVDIGGGSTELIVGRAGPRTAGAAAPAEPLRIASVRIGSVRLTERLLHTDPPTVGEKRALVETIDRAFDAAPAPEGELVGVAGTVTTLCAIALGLADYDGERVHGARIARARLDEIVARLGEQPLAERLRTPGLHPKRADVIYAGGVILARLLDRARAPEVRVSDRGIRWGLAEELASVETPAR